MTETGRQILWALGITAAIVLVAVIFAIEGPRAPTKLEEMEKGLEEYKEGWEKLEERFREAQLSGDLVGMERVLQEMDELNEKYSDEPDVSAPPEPVDISVWENIIFVDEWGDRTDDLGATSEIVLGRRWQGYLYRDRRAKILVNCNQAWFVFTGDINLSGPYDSDGAYYYYKAGLRVDGESSDLTISERRRGDDGRTVYVVYDGPFIQKLKTGRKLDIRFPWFQDEPIFSWDLTGAAEAINKSCEQ